MSRRRCRAARAWLWCGARLGLLLSAGACAQPEARERAMEAIVLDPQSLAEDAATFAQLAQVPPGAQAPQAVSAEVGTAVLGNFGYLPTVRAAEGEASAFRREVALEDELAPLVPMGTATRGGGDVIAIISIDRAPRARNYVLGTLASLLDALPVGSAINVLVGDDRADYLGPEPLMAALGASRAQQIFVWPTGAAAAAFMARHFTLYQRGSWNYARALRSYRGQGGLLIFEDDILLAEGAATSLGEVLSAGPPAWVSLYNGDCLRRPRPMMSPLLEIFAVSSAERVFVGAQGSFLPKDLAAALGRFMHLRLHIEATDGLITRFGRLHDVPVHFAYPSLVQHVGRQTTGLAGGWHDSGCYRTPAPPGR